MLDSGVISTSKFLISETILVFSFWISAEPIIFPFSKLCSLLRIKQPSSMACHCRIPIMTGLSGKWPLVKGWSFGNVYVKVALFCEL